MATFLATTATNSFTGAGSDNDTFVVTATNQIQSTDLFDGAAGTDDIHIGDAGTPAPTVSLTAAGTGAGVGFRNIEGLTFEGAGSVTLSAAQFGTGLISTALAVTGTTGVQSVAITGASNFSAADWTFTSWDSGSDRMTIDGTTSADTIVGSSQADIITAGFGADSVSAGGGDDTIVVSSSSQLAAGEAVDGGDGTDTLSLTGGSQVYALQTGTVTGVEAISGATGSIQYVRLSPTQINGFSSIDLGGDGDTVEMTLPGGVAEMSAADMPTTTGVATRLLAGSSGADTIRLSGAQLDYFTDINLGAGSNTIELTSTSTGLNGLADAKVLQVTTISAAPATADVIIDLHNQSEGFVIVGGSGDDTLTGTGASDTITGGAGDDVIAAGAGTDRIVGYEGDDHVDGGADYDYLVINTSQPDLASAADDRIVGIEAVTAASAGAGVTFDLSTQSEGFTINGSGHADTVTGGSGADTAYLGNGDDVFVGFTTGDTVSGDGGFDTIRLDATSAALNASDYYHVIYVEAVDASTAAQGVVIDLGGQNTGFRITGSAHADEITGGYGGSDVIVGFVGADTVIGGGGNDSIALTETSADLNAATDARIQGIRTVTAASAADGVSIDLVGQSEGFSIIGSSYDDTIAGGSGSDVISGGAGADRLDGGAGTDTCTGGTGDDTFYVGSAADKVVEATGEGTDTVYAAVDYTLGAGVSVEYLRAGASGLHLTGNELDNTLVGTAGDDALAGGAGTDTADYSGASSGVSLDLRSTSPQETLGAGRDSLTGIENLIGSSHGDQLVGDTTTTNVLTGGDGDDSYRIVDSDDVVVEAANGGTDRVYAEVDFTLAAGSEVEEMIGNAGGGLALGGSDTDNLIYGNAGNDTLSGNGGDDVILGDAGDDTIDGGDGFDVATYESAATGVTVDLAITAAQNTGGAGTDTLTGIEGVIGTDHADTLSGDGGANQLVGGDGDDVLDGRAGADEMAGGTGDDRYQVDDADDVVIEDVGEGRDTLYAAASYELAAGSEIERMFVASGHSGLTLTGNELANVMYGGTGVDTLIGGGGDDALYGRAGADTLAGGAGDDRFYIDDAGDTVTEAVGEGDDAVYASASFTLGAGQEVERLYVSGTSAGVTLGGNEFANIIYGGAGADTLNGGGGKDAFYGRGGDDTMAGGSGDDRFYVDDAGDTVIEAVGEGSDTVYASVSFALGAGQEVERLYVSGTSAGLTLTGNELANTLSGGTGGDTLIGGGGKDTLEGRGGDDAMSGGLGDDRFDVDDVGDTVFEAVGEGTDSVYASVAFTLAAGQEIERLYADAGSAGLALTGNEFDNVIYGAGGADTLAGGGGDDALYGRGGADTMSGGLGDDRFYVDDAADAVSEGAGGGTDTVYTSVSYALAAGQEIERLSVSGTSAGLTLTGNEFDNVIYGGGGVDTLAGGDGDDALYGRGGADTMAGGDGDDRFYVDDAADVVEEATGEGTDTVYASVSYVLASDQAVERLYASGTSAGLTLTGNDLANLVYGGDGDDTLIGGGRGDTLKGYDGDDRFDGGTGIDRLYGGDGADTFVLANVSADRDTILDFEAADMFEVSAARFGGGLVVGALADGQFWASSAGTAHDADDRFVYDTDNGYLYYDADGIGGTGRVLVAIVSGAPTLTSANFDIVA